MAKKLIIGIVVVFFLLVGANYAYTLASGFFGGHGYGYGSPFASTFFDAGPGNATHEMTAVRFNVFDKGGDGLSYVTQGYGHTPYSYEYPNGWHDGIDIAAAYGAPIYPPAFGVVLATGNQDNYCYHRAFGMFVAVYDPKNNFVWWFAHLGTLAVAPGEKVTTSTELGTIGATGFETGAHLHFSIFDGTNFSMAGVQGCGPGPTASDRDLNPLSYLGSTYQ